MLVLDLLLVRLGWTRCDGGSGGYRERRSRHGSERAERRPVDAVDVSIRLVARHGQPVRYRALLLLLLLLLFESELL